MEVVTFEAALDPLGEQFAVPAPERFCEHEVERRLPSCSLCGYATVEQRPVERGGLIVGAGEHSHLLGTMSYGECGHEVGDTLRFCVLVGEGQRSHRVRCGTVRQGCVVLTSSAECSCCRLHHLWAAAIVRVQFDHGDARVGALYLTEQGVVGSVPAVDGLSRIADQTQVGASISNGFQHRMLQRVEVLCFVDEQVSIAPPDAIGPCAVSTHEL